MEGKPDFEGYGDEGARIISAASLSTVSWTEVPRW
jgi:hypothetical protein